MVIILVALTFFGAILAVSVARHLSQKREVPRAVLRRGQMILAPVAAVPDFGRALQFPNSVYYHNGHAWAKLDEDNRVRIGLDDFTQQVMGDIEDIEIPSIGSQLKQGEVAWKLSQGKRKLSQLAPLGGTVVELNEKLIKDPSLANSSPYEKGWILKIQPKAFSEEMPELMDSFQFQVHFDRLKSKLLRPSFSHQSLGMVYGDGGEVVKGLGGILEERWWKILVTELFHTSPE